MHRIGRVRRENEGQEHRAQKNIRLLRFIFLPLFSCPCFPVGCDFSGLHQTVSENGLRQAWRCRWFQRRRWIAGEARAGLFRVNRSYLPRRARREEQSRQLAVGSRQKSVAREARQVVGNRCYSLLPDFFVCFVFSVVSKCDFLYY